MTAPPSPVVYLDQTDKKWLDTLELMYPVIGAALPFYKLTDGSVDAFRTLEQFFRLIDVKLGPDGRVLEPHGSS